MSLKDDWKSVGKDFGRLGSDLGKSIIRTVKKGVNAVDKWSEEEAQVQTPVANTADDKTENDAEAVTAKNED